MIATIPSWLPTLFWALFLGLLSAQLLTFWLRRLQPAARTESAQRLPAILLGAGMFAFFQGLAILPQTRVDWANYEGLLLLDRFLTVINRYLLQGIVDVSLTACSFLLAGAAIVLSPTAFGGGTVRALGIGTGSLVRGFVHGFITFLIILPGFVGVTMLCRSVLLSVGVEVEEQTSVTLARGYLEMGHPGILSVAAVVVLVAPVVEELLFRASIFPALAKGLGTRAGIVVSGLIFGLIHGNAVAFVPLSLLGIVLAALYHRTRNLFACIGLHFSFNLAQTAGLVLFSRLSA